MVYIIKKYYNDLLSIGIHSITANCGKTFEGKNNDKEKTDTLAADTDTADDIRIVQALLG